MASTSAGSSKNDCKMPLKIVHHEKGDSIVIFWSIQTFDYILHDLEFAVTSPFTVNGSSGLKWRIILHFRENKHFIGATLRLVSPIPSDLRVTWSVALVELCGDYKRVRECMEVSNFTEDLKFPRLVHKYFLMDEQERYFKNDTLTLRCEVNTATNIMSPNSFAPSEYFKIISEGDTICKLMKDLHVTRMFSDFTFVADLVVENKVHKPVLSARSPVFAKLFATLPAKENEETIRDTTQEKLSALLAYMYTGNPYNIGCIPLDFKPVAGKHNLPLLEHFAEPNTLSFRSRIKVKQKKLVLKVKNFFSQISTEAERKQQRIILVDFDIGDDFRSTWQLFLDLRENNRIYFRLEKTSCKYFPFKTVLTFFILNNLNRYERLGAHIMMCDGFHRERFSFVMDAENKRFNRDNHLTLQILVKVSFSLIIEHNHFYERTFFSEICEAVQMVPPDFVQLKKDICIMYNSELYPNLVLLLAREPHIQVLAHKFMVGLHSDFLIYFLDDSDEQLAIPLEDISKYDLGILTNFMYTGFLYNLELDYLGHLLIIAKAFKFFRLRKVLLEIFHSNLNIGNAREIFRIACVCKEEELKVEAFRLAQYGSDTNLPSTSQASGNDQVTSPRTGIRSQDALKLCQPRVEREYVETSPRTSKETGKRSKDAVRVRQSIVEREYAETSAGASDETGLSSQDAVRVCQPRVESEYIEASRQTSEESQYKKKNPEPSQITVPRSQLKTKYVTPDLRTSVEDLDSVKKVQTLKYLDQETSVEPGVKSQPPVKRSILAVKSEHSQENKKKVKKVVSWGQNVEELGPPVIQRYAMELEGLALRVIPCAMRRDLIPSSRAIDTHKDPEAKSRVTSKDSEAKSSVTSKDSEAKSSVTSKDSEAKSSVKNKDLEAKSTEKNEDLETKCTEKNNDSEAKSTEKNDPEAKSFEKKVDFEGSTQTSAENQNWTVSPQTAEEGQDSENSIKDKDFDRNYVIKKQKVGLDAKSSVKNKVPEAKNTAKDKDPEAKSNAKDKDPEAKSTEKNKDPEAKGIEKNKDPEAKGIEKNKDPEAKGIEKNIDLETRTQTSRESRNLTVSPQTAADQDSKAASSSKRKREDS